MFECKQDIGGVEAGSVLLEAANLGEIKEKFTSGAVFQTEEKFIF
jgi:hypothetical protein